MPETGRINTESPIDLAVAHWMGLAARKPRSALAILAVLIVASLLAMTRLGVDPDSSKMLSPDLPAQRQALALNDAFPDLKRTLLIVVKAPSVDEADIVVGALTTALGAGQGWIAETFATSVDPFFATNGFLYRDLEAVEGMFTRISKSANLVARLRETQTLEGFARSLNEAAALAEGAQIAPDALNRLYIEAARVFEAHLAGGRHPFGWSTVMDDDAPTGSVARVISVIPHLDTKRISPAKPALAEINDAIDALPSHLRAGVTIAVTGEPALRAEEMQSVLDTIGISLALSLLLVAVILRVGLGSTGRAATAFGSLVISLVLTTGVAAVVVGQLNLVSVAFVVLMVGLGIDFAIHILAHIREMRTTGTEAVAAVNLTGRRSGLALGLSAITTSVAFLAFVTTDFQGMAQLGMIGGLGVLIAFAVAMTFIPALVALRPSMAGEPHQTEIASTRRPRDGTAPAVALLVVGAVAVLPALQARFDADPMGLRDPNASSVQAFDILASDPATTPYRASVLVPSLGEAETVAGRLVLTKGIGTAITLTDLIPSEQDAKLEYLDFAAPSIEHAIQGTATDLGPAPDAPPLLTLAARLEGGKTAEQRLSSVLRTYLSGRTLSADTAVRNALFETFPLMLSRLGAMLDADYVTAESLPPMLRGRFVSDTGLFRVDVLPEQALRTTEEVAAFADAVISAEPRAAGGPAQLAAAGRSVGSAMLQATALAALATLILAFVATRRAVDTAAILVPLIVAGILTAAASSLLDIPFNYANVIVLPLLIGIGVDSGIHIALRERRAPGAVFSTSTPRAVFFSALTTMAAFGTLTLSDHQGTASMGALLAIAMTTAVGSVLILTPTLIRWARRDARHG